MLNAFISLFLLVGTVTLSLARPKILGLRFDHSAAAVLGGSLTVMTGLVPLDAVFHALSSLVYPLVTIVSLMIITTLADRAGLMVWLTDFILRSARGDGHRLFSLIFITGCVMGAVFTNDAAVLILTPLVFVLVERVAEPHWGLRERLPFYFAVLYVGNVAAFFVISNPIDIIVASLFDISFVEFTIWNALPAISSMIVSYIGLRIFFSGSIPKTFLVKESVHSSLRPTPMGWACLVVICIMMIGFLVQSLTGLPIPGVAAASALMLLAVYSASGHAVTPIVKSVGWDVIIFVVGIFIVAIGARNSGLTHLLGEAIMFLSGESFERLLFASALISGLCSSVINNHPTAGLMVWVIEDFNMQSLQAKFVAYAALIGGDLGPKMLPIGSLAAMMWFRILRSRGVDVSYWLYVKIGVPVTLFSIFIAITVLLLQMQVFNVFY
jgi:arsenical pump membrane protein